MPMCVLGSLRGCETELTQGGEWAWDLAGNPERQCSTIALVVGTEVSAIREIP